MFHGQSRFLGLVVMGLVAATSGCAVETRQVVDDSSPTTPEETEDDGTSTGEDTPGTGGSKSGGKTTPEPRPEQAGCAQDAYTETLPTKTSLSSLTFSQSKAKDYLVAALERRFPAGKAIVEGGVSSSMSASQGNCIDKYLSDKSSAQAVLRQASTVVHECGHFYDLSEASGNSSVYVIRPGAVTFTCKAGDTTSRGGKTFARSLLKTDAYYSHRKACPTGTAASGCDMYANIYLNGSAKDSTFDSGDQGYSLLLEEASQYVNSLAAALAFQDAYTSSKASERDGILTFLWYIERYLAMARAEYPDAYALLSQDACWRQATLTVWDRGWFYLEATKDKDSLGIDDAEIETLVNEPALRAEIDTLRQLECK